MAQRYIPTFEDWNANMTFQGSTAARGSAKYYNAFLKDMQDRPQFIDTIMEQHGMSEFNRDIEAPTMEAMGFEAPEAPDTAGLQDAEDKRVEEARIKQGGIDRDAAFSAYTDAAATAASSVDISIRAEQAQAALSGTEYLMTDDLRQTRVNDYFANIYSEQDYQGLVDLYDEFGKPEGESGYEGFSTVRGITNEAEVDTTLTTAFSPSTGQAPAGALAGDDEDDILGTTSILGGG